MKQAVFLALDHGQDGRDRERIKFASTVEAERDQFIETSKIKQYLSKADRVIDLAEQHDKSLAKLDGLDKLALGLHKPTAQRGGSVSSDQTQVFKASLQLVADIVEAIMKQQYPEDPDFFKDAPIWDKIRLIGKDLELSTAKLKMADKTLKRIAGYFAGIHKSDLNRSELKIVDIFKQQDYMAEDEYGNLYDQSHKDFEKYLRLQKQE